MNVLKKTDEAPMFYLPIGLFGSVMSLCGLSLAWKLAASMYDLPVIIGKYIGLLAIIVFFVLLISYGIKCIYALPEVRAEFNHPITINLFGTFIVSLLLLPAVILPYNIVMAELLWVLGAVLMVLFAWMIIGRWMNIRQNPEHASPPWIIPVVGTLDIPIAGNLIDPSGTHQLALFSLAVGLFFALPLFTIIFSRLLFEAPMSDALRPSLMILLAPFSVGFSAYVGTLGHIDTFASLLFYVSVFLFFALLPKLLSLGKCCPFRISWWAIGFPLAATAIAALKYASHTQSHFHDLLASSLLAFATIVIFGLGVRTLRGIVAGDLKRLK